MTTVCSELLVWCQSEVIEQLNLLRIFLFPHRSVPLNPTRTQTQCLSHSEETFEELLQLSPFQVGIFREPFKASKRVPQNTQSGNFHFQRAAVAPHPPAIGLPASRANCLGGER